MSDKLLRLGLLAASTVIIPAVPASGQGPPLRAGLTSELSIGAVPGAVYHWELYNGEPADFAGSPGDCPEGSACFADGINNRPTVYIQWNHQGVYFWKSTVITAEGCSNFKVGRIVVGDLTETENPLECRVISNPSVNGVIRFRIRVPRESETVIELYSPAGQLVGRMDCGPIGPGTREEVRLPMTLAQGLYFYRILTDLETVSGRVVVVPVY